MTDFDILQTIDPDHADTFDTRYVEWTGRLAALFPQPEEYQLARAIYSFQTAYEDGMTPQQAYDDFNEWTQE